MDQYEYRFNLHKRLKIGAITKVGVAGSGNLEVVIRPNTSTMTHITVHTSVAGFKAIWDEVIARFVAEYPYNGLDIVLNDAGATPAVVFLRLGQAIETYQKGYPKKIRYTEASARNRIYSLVDSEQFTEFLLNEETKSPTLPQLGLQGESDDGVVIGSAQIAGELVAIAAQEKDFIGGSVGEVHGAKLNGLVKYAIKHRLSAIIFLIDSGGVRLQEANVGEIEISEIIRSLLDARSAGIKTIGVVCGANGAYGGMGIISGCMEYLIVNQGARIGVSGAEVIQAVAGAEVFDSSDRPLVWRVYGGRTRLLQGAAQDYTTNQMTDIRQALIKAIHTPATPLDLAYLLKEQEQLTQRVAKAKNCTEQGEWLAEAAPELIQQEVFSCSDKQFLALAKKETNHGL